MSTGINVGAKLDEATLASILQILESRADQRTIRCALNVLGKSLSVGDVSISSCSINMPTINVADDTYNTEEEV